VANIYEQKNPKPKKRMKCNSMARTPTKNDVEFLQRKVLPENFAEDVLNAEMRID